MLTSFWRHNILYQSLPSSKKSFVDVDNDDKRSHWFFHFLSLFSQLEHDIFYMSSVFILMHASSTYFWYRIVSLTCQPPKVRVLDIQPREGLCYLTTPYINFSVNCNLCWWPDKRNIFYLRGKGSSLHHIFNLFLGPRGRLLSLHCRPSVHP